MDTSCLENLYHSLKAHSRLLQPEILCFKPEVLRSFYSTLADH